MKAYPAITGIRCFTNDSSVRIFVPEYNYYEWISNAATWGLTASQIHKDTFIHFDKNSVTSNSIIYFVEKLSCTSAPLSMKITDIYFDSDILSAVTVDKMLYKISGNNIFVCVKATIGTIKDTTKNPYVLFIHEVYDASGNKIDFTQGGYYVYTYSASTEKYIESFYDKITAPIVKFTTGEKYDYTL
jgi:galactitol-specific phosphotransferase system IIB component